MDVACGVDKAMLFIGWIGLSLLADDAELIAAGIAKGVPPIGELELVPLEASIPWLA